MKTQTIVICLALLFITIGCTDRAPEPAKPAEPPRTFVFECNEGPDFTARIEGEIAALFLPAGTQRLAREAGDLYRGEAINFRIDGNEASLKVGEDDYQCRNNRRAAIWEHAKLNGADFRAIGNEPGWHMEIHQQSKMVLVTDYGASRFEFDLPAAETNPDKRTTRYRIKHESRNVTVTISGQACSDSMSGEKFESNVTVDFDGRILRGCGKALH